MSSTAMLESPEPLLVVRNVSKSYRRGAETIPVLRDVSFSLLPGQMTAVVGASGCGKSTLLHVVGTLDAPDGGDISYEGTALTGASDQALARFRNRELGFVFQFHHLLPDFSALENVVMPLLIGDMGAVEAETEAAALLEKVGLSHRIRHSPGELSGGEQQRVALARALACRPRILLADEVTGNLDARTGEEIHDLLFALNEELGTTMLIVTHDAHLASRMPHCFRLADGTLVEESQG